VRHVSVVRAARGVPSKRIPYSPSRYNRRPAMALLDIRGLARSLYGTRAF